MGSHPVIRLRQRSVLAATVGLILGAAALYSARVGAIPRFDLCEIDGHHYSPGACVEATQICEDFTKMVCQDDGHWYCGNTCDGPSGGT